MDDQRKVRALRRMDRKALENILAKAEEAAATIARPLAGKVHVQGVGYITVNRIRKEIEARG